MALYSVMEGSTTLIPLFVQWLGGAGDAMNPTGTPTVSVYGGNPLTVITTMNCTQSLSLTGFWGAFLDVSNVTDFPAGEYIVRWSAVVETISTSRSDALTIQEV